VGDIGSVAQADFGTAVRELVTSSNAFDIALRNTPNSTAIEVSYRHDIGEYTEEVWFCARAKTLGRCASTATVQASQ